MSDYGDDYSDYGEEWMYIEDEYMPADDLAEHAVNSPPPTQYLDDDAISDWDRFEYFNDLEYDSDGYDDAKFYTHNPSSEKTGEKRKRGGTAQHSKKKQKLVGELAASRTESIQTALSPVVWRSREAKPQPRTLDDQDVEPYALLKDWRERVADAPSWIKKAGQSGKDKENAEPETPSSSSEFEDMEDDEQEQGVDEAALMASLQANLSAAGGPLSGLDPQQLLQFAMRMMADKDAGDDIAGELADSMLEQAGDEEEEGEPADLVSWLSKQRGTEQGESSRTGVSGARAPPSRSVEYGGNRPPTPPSSEANRTIKAAENHRLGTSSQQTEKATAAHRNNFTLPPAQGTSSRKRKVQDNGDDDGSTNVSKKRSTRSYDAPTATSSARAGAPPRATRHGRTKRS
ncbi:hypothetical protein EJ04DRAFT_494641 [Polyplosphaeria fusca]|uniref:Uncharacterized protein n=1 Tax=Polyplosphaeria fusca TaxID=682080 RepID=A0A9P4V2Y7_9PLEO|nr:hypothetical protein EJ04DRAFT_494641 [Polyplosphaeria fusca]